MGVINLGPLGLPVEKVLPQITFQVGSNIYNIGNQNSSQSGIYKFAIQKDSNTKIYNWELAILTSGQINFKKSSKTIDAFLVAGGKNGQNGYMNENNGYYYGGKGGNGGGTSTINNYSISSHESLDSLSPPRSLPLPSNRRVSVPEALLRWGQHSPGRRGSPYPSHAAHPDHG